MDKPALTKRRKTEDRDSSSNQVDAHIRAFLNAVITNSQKSINSSLSAKDALASVVSRSLAKRRRNVVRSDASTQTEEEFFADPQALKPPPPLSPTSLLSENAAAYYASATNEENLFLSNAGPSNTDLQYFASDSTTKISSTEIRQLLTDWMQQYEQWFYQNFGVDVNSVPSEPSIPPPPPPPPPSSHQNLENDRAVACQTPLHIASGPVMYSQPVIYSAPANLNPLASFFSAQMAAQNLLSEFFIAQQTQQQLMAAATAAAASLSALPTPVVCLPPVKHYRHPRSNHTTSEMESAAIDSKMSNSPELCGPVTHYGAYGILRPCPIDVSETQKQSNICVSGQSGNGTDTDSLPIYITPENYRNKLRSWMPPPPPTVLLLRKQALICVLQLHICNKVHEINLRKAAATKAPVAIDYVAALETTVERHAKAKVTYVYNRICRLPIEAQHLFLRGFKHSDPPTPPMAPVTTALNGSPEVDIKEAESVASLSMDQENGSVCNLATLDVEEDVDSSPDDEDNENEGTGVDAECEEHSRAMYICDLLIGDIFICQALADCKLQAKACAARKALTLLSKPNFLVGGVRIWHGSDESDGPLDYLVLCLSPKADQVPRLTPFLADPLLPIPSEQPISPGDPSETFKVCNPKPFHDLWLYTARSIAVNTETTCTPEQFLAQSAEFSQMTVNFEVEFDSVTGIFTNYGLIDAQRCAKVSADSIPIGRFQVASRLLRRLKITQPIVGLLLPPPDPADELAGPQTRDIDDSMHPLWGLTEASIVDSLMWGKHEKQFALPIEHLEAHCEVCVPPAKDVTSDAEFAATGSGFFTSRGHLEQYLEAYAASALVTPLRISLRALPHALWHIARTVAHSWGLLTRIEFEVPDHIHTAFLLVCKRAPLPRLKRTLFERTEVGVFYLLSRGALPPSALHILTEADLLPEADTEPSTCALPSPIDPIALPSPPSSTNQFVQEDNDPLTRMARTFHATAVKQEAKESSSPAKEEEADLLLVAAELNQPSNAVEIIDDLPRQLIPGIDF